MNLPRLLFVFETQAEPPAEKRPQPLKSAKYPPEERRAVMERIIEFQSRSFDFDTEVAAKLEEEFGAPVIAYKYQGDSKERAVVCILNWGDWYEKRTAAAKTFKAVPPVLKRLIGWVYFKDWWRMAISNEWIWKSPNDLRVFIEWMEVFVPDETCTLWENTPYHGLAENAWIGYTDRGIFTRPDHQHIMAEKKRIEYETRMHPEYLAFEKEGWSFWWCDDEEDAKRWLPSFQRGGQDEVVMYEGHRLLNAPAEWVIRYRKIEGGEEK